MASLGGRRNPRGVALGSVPDERGLAPPDMPTARPGDRTEGDGSSDWITLTALAAAAIFVCYADRSNISTAIIPMAKAFSWDKVAEGGVLSAFFYGYGMTQIVGGRAADRFGGKNVLLFGVVAWSLATFFTPAAAAAGAAPLLLARAALGAGEGVAFPAVHSLIARHVPFERRTTAVATVTAASYAGAAFAFGVTPRVVLAGGWEAAFYAFGAAALLWVPLWVPATFEVVVDVETETETSDDTNESEKANTATRSIGLDRSETFATRETDVSKKNSWFDEWRALTRTKEVRAICVAQFAQSWGSYGLLSWLPTYFDEALGVPLGDLPAFTVLPYFIQGVVGVASGVCADALVEKNIASTLFVRRAFQAFGMVGPAVCLLAAAWLGHGGVDGRVADANVLGAAVCVDVGLALSALTLAGVSVSHLDVAPKHAGLVFATGNTCATIAGLIAVPVSGLILERTNQNWSVVFGVIAAVFVLGAAVWCAWVGDRPVAADDVGVERA
jgi:ACS family sodium-dependent inorganic phosphate cotransporter